VGWLLHWLTVHTGSSNTPGAPANYNFWSGFGSDLGELALIGGLVAIYKRHTCHVHRCWRIGRHQVEGTPHVVCRKHHPDGHLTAGDIHAAHQTAAQEQGG
jgi:hypothetical protein